MSFVCVSGSLYRHASYPGPASIAYWAARAGLEWEIPQVIAANNCPAPSATLVLDTFNLEISCSAASYNEGVTVTMVTMKSVACKPGPCTSGSGVGSIGYAERSLSASVETKF